MAFHTLSFPPLLLAAFISPVLGQLQPNDGAGQGLFTEERLALLAGVFAVATVLSLVWVFVLRRQGDQQSRQIKLQRDEYKALKERYQKVIGAAGDFIFTADSKGRFQSINPAGERMTGYSSEEIREMNLRDLLSASGDEFPADAELEDAIAKTGEFILEGRLLRHDGSTIWTETTLRLFRERGRRSGILGITRNVSDRKQIEQEVKRAQEAAEMDTRAKSQYLANMSHEVRTPMNAIIGMCDILLGTKLDQQQREFANTIRGGADSLLEVLDSVLDFSRAETARQQLDTIDFDLRDTLESTIELLSARASAKDLELIVFLPPTEPCLLRGDPGQLRQIILNLLRNAIEFTGKGRVVIRVHAVSESAADARLRFEIEDTGIGIPKETIPLLFHPFRRDGASPATQAQRFGKTGLGLTIARQIIEIIGGTYGVTSEPGQGSIFWCELPFAKQSDTQISPAESRIGETSGRRILLATGSKVHTQLLDVYTRALGLSRRLARDRDEVLESLQHAALGGDSYDAIVVDHEPPALNGLAVVRAIRAKYALEVPPIVLLSSLSGDHASKDLKALKIAGRVAKPVRFDALGQAILRAMRMKKDEPARTQKNPQSAPSPKEKKGLRVLLAEDNRVNQRVALLLLERLGHTCDAATNGKEVLRLLETKDYDAILMDCQMPEMDGFECTAKIREKYPQGQYRIIAVTANAMQGDRERCLAAGMDDYLAKPMRLPALQAALDQVFLPEGSVEVK